LPDLSTELSWPAPAKLNLFLHITSQRDDGYHLLQTVFQILDYGDELRFSPRGDGQIVRVTEVEGVAEEQDLIVRAARLLQSHAGTSLGIDIGIDKKLPMGGGLGGGSSDAATTLVALNQIWDCGLSVDELAALGIKLGADVPVFVRGQSAWAEGVGEQLEPIILPEPWFLVLIPPVHASTAHVFSNPQLRRDCPPITIRDFLAGSVTENVCEPLVRESFPEVKAALQDLGQYAEARMTGTGACVFAAFETQSAAQTAWMALKENWQGFVAQGVNVSPLLVRAGC
jgi:4-diphosphocytidyl-2-C-methyl-D-erythritol kinase